ncbi:transmembrane sensor [Catalinimonas alkaloidigena]|uniref:FecR family protein n=1 Tax=Catalinimonas alkaloidigena TaxID=1075417 RepID=UPI002404C426|nr:FecR domain-containing protein [Catalinimonas alkaloidigena]MDF9794927.1 transmembrane sensor [Catalinimonas alkaloidigena]
MFYNQYTALDFAMDEYFQRWVFTRDAEVSDYWQTWLALHPEKKEAIEEAKILLSLQKLRKDEWSADRMLMTKERIRESLDEQNKPDASSAPPKDKDNKRLMSPWLAIAASLLLIVSIMLPVYILSQDEQVFSTTYGETQKFELPDGSEVILNANSSLRFAEDWQKKEQRQVWLEGEAFFKVSKLTIPDRNEAIKFIVRLQDIDVEVVGTAFNVNHRSGKVEVSLDEGIVDLKMTGGERLRMEPGDMVAYSAATQRLDKLNANPKKVTAWRNHQMILDGQPLSDLAILINNYYGVEIRFSSDELADKKIKTTLPTDNLDLVLETLELMLDVQLERSEDEIIMK